MEYHSGNYEKYMSTNVLKKFMVGKFNQKITSIAREAVRNAGSESLILDAGCGEGFLSCLISNDVPYAKVIGIDASADAIRMAGALNKEICFQQGDMLYLGRQTNRQIGGQNINGLFSKWLE